MKESALVLLVLVGLAAAGPSDLNINRMLRLDKKGGDYPLDYNRILRLAKKSGGIDYNRMFRLSKKAGVSPDKRQALQKILLRYGKRSGDSEDMERMRRDFRNCFFSPVQCYMREGAIARK